MNMFSESTSECESRPDKTENASNNRLEIMDDMGGIGMIDILLGKKVLIFAEKWKGQLPI
jgi:hypothetical protein